jgi:hypothetical protein
MSQINQTFIPANDLKRKKADKIFTLRNFPHPSILLLINCIVVVFSSCQTSEKVASSGFIQNRKYQPGFYTTIITKSAKKPKENSVFNLKIPSPNCSVNKPALKTDSFALAVIKPYIPSTSLKQSAPVYASLKQETGRPFSSQKRLLTEVSTSSILKTKNFRKITNTSKELELNKALLPPDGEALIPLTVFFIFSFCLFLLSALFFLIFPYLFFEVLILIFAGISLLSFIASLITIKGRSFSASLKNLSSWLIAEVLALILEFIILWIKVFSRSH